MQRTTSSDLCSLLGCTIPRQQGGARFHCQAQRCSRRANQSTAQGYRRRQELSTCRLSTKNESKDVATSSSFLIGVVNLIGPVNQDRWYELIEPLHQEIRKTALVYILTPERCSTRHRYMSWDSTTVVAFTMCIVYAMGSMQNARKSSRVGFCRESTFQGGSFLGLTSSRTNLFAKF